MNYYTLRYAGDTPLRDRKHGPTVGRWDTYEAADAARVSTPRPELLEVVLRTDEAAQ